MDEDEPQESIVELLDELLMMEMLRGQRDLEPEEARRWVELQRDLTRELCAGATPETVSINERRHYLRVASELAVRVLSPGANFEATVLDLGAGGMGLKASLLPFVGETVRLEWARTPGGEQLELDLAARVMWMRKATHELGAGFGIAFEPETRAEVHRISSLLLTLLRRERASRAR